MLMRLLPNSFDGGVRIHMPVGGLWAVSPPPDILILTTELVFLTQVLN